MDLLAAQIKKSHLDGASVEDICAQLNCDKTAVNNVLYDTVDFSDEDAAAAARVIKSIALHGENERNKLNAATYIYDVKKGFRVNRNPTAGISAGEINILITQAAHDVNGLIEQLRRNPSRQANAVDCRTQLEESQSGDGSPPQTPSSENSTSLLYAADTPAAPQGI